MGGRTQGDAGEMAQCLGTFAALPEDPALIPSTPVAVQVHLQFQFQESNTFSWPLRAAGTHRHTHRQKHPYT